LAEQAEEGGVEGALFDEQGAAGNLTDVQEDAVAVERTQRDSFQDQLVERAGDELGGVSQSDFVFVRFWHRVYMLS
jgi:hypothetical protein